MAMLHSSGSIIGLIRGSSSILQATQVQYTLVFRAMLGLEILLVTVAGASGDDVGDCSLPSSVR